MLPEKRKRKNKATEIDKIIGQRLRDLRLMRDMSQQELGIIVHITFQQIQKYEKGMNRIAASTLLMLADALGVAPYYFMPEQYRSHEVMKGPQWMEERLARLECALSDLEKSNDEAGALIKSVISLKTKALRR